MRATFENRDQARAAVAALRQVGLPESAIQMGTLGNEAEMGAPMSSLTKEVPQAVLFGLGGAALGALLGVMAAFGLLSESLLALVGPNALIAALKGAAAVGGTGILFGYILGLGMWEDDGEPGAGAPRAGSVTVTVSDTAAGVERVSLETVRHALEGAGGVVLGG